MDGYSRLVALLKVVLPLAALGLLSTLFLLSRSIDPMAALPFADDEIALRLDGQQITAPTFSGTTDTGDLVAVRARTLQTTASQDNTARTVTGQIDLTSGTRIDLRADEGLFGTTNVSELRGNVVLTSTTGYRVTSDVLLTDLQTLSLTSPGPVAATGPAGTLNAGGMRLRQSDGGQNTHLVFTNGVKLVYEPRQQEK